MLNKILVRVNNLDEVKEYQEKGINNFLFPLKDYSIGYNSFKVEEINQVEGNIYLLLNRLLDNNDIDNFKKIIPKLNNVKGVFFEDIGIYELLKNSNIPLIWNQAHFVINSKSINYWLKLVDSACLSNELTKSEIKYILEHVTKNIVLPLFGYNMMMYSRRYLLTNYALHYNYPINKELHLKTANQLPVLAKENEYGTVFFYDKYFNYLPLINEFNEHILLYYLDPVNLNPSMMLDIINGKDISYDNRFLENKTIYKLEEK